MKTVLGYGIPFIHYIIQSDNNDVLPWDKNFVPAVYTMKWDDWSDDFFPDFGGFPKPKKKMKPTTNAGNMCSTGGTCTQHRRSSCEFPDKDIPSKINEDDIIICAQNIGMNCKKCNWYNEYAGPNQDDKTYLCYKCKKNL